MELICKTKGISRSIYHIEPEELRLVNLLLYKGELVYVSALSYDIDDKYQELIGVTPFGRTSAEVYKWNREFGGDLQRIIVTQSLMIALGNWSMKVKLMRRLLIYFTTMNFPFSCTLSPSTVK